MNPSIPKIIRMLTDTAKYPQTFAYTVEPMLMRITTLLEVCEIKDFSAVEFYCKHGGRNGNAYLMEIPKDVTFDQWTKNMVADAISMIEAQYMGQNETPKTV